MLSIQRKTTIQNTFAPKPIGPFRKRKAERKKKLKKAALNLTEQLSKEKMLGIKKRTKQYGNRKNNNTGGRRERGDFLNG